MPDEYRAITEFYDAEYADLDILGPDVEFFLAQIGDQPLSVVEIGCGTGRATRRIAAGGHRAVGFDVDAGMLKIAREKGGGPNYVEADATDEDWPNAVDGHLDVACCFFNTFLAFADPEDQEACLGAAHRALRPGGVLWLDIFHPNLELIVGSVGGADELEPDLFYLPDGRTVLRTTSLYADVTRQVQHVTFTYQWFEQGRRQEAHRGFNMTWIMPRELDRLLRLCGFEIEETWGDYDGGPVDDDAERQIVKARRVDS